MNTSCLRPLRIFRCGLNREDWWEWSFHTLQVTGHIHQGIVHFHVDVHILHSVVGSYVDLTQKVPSSTSLDVYCLSKTDQRECDIQLVCATLWNWLIHHKNQKICQNTYQFQLCYRYCINLIISNISRTVEVCGRKIFVYSNRKRPRYIHHFLTCLMMSK